MIILVIVLILFSIYSILTVVFAHLEHTKHKEFYKNLENYNKYRNYIYVNYYLPCKTLRAKINKLETAKRYIPTTSLAAYDKELDKLKEKYQYELRRLLMKEEKIMAKREELKVYRIQHHLRFT